jgi:hypothetical protein
MSKSRKILISPGHGAGWSTWADPRSVQLLCMTYPPLVDLVENHPEEVANLSSDHPIIQGLLDEAHRLEPNSHIHIGGNVCQLVVFEVNGPFYVDDYDGSESVVTEEDLVISLDDLPMPPLNATGKSIV